MLPMKLVSVWNPPNRKTMERSGCSLVDPLLPVAIYTRVADRK